MHGIRKHRNKAVAFVLAVFMSSGLATTPIQAAALPTPLHLATAPLENNQAGRQQGQLGQSGLTLKQMQAYRQSAPTGLKPPPVDFKPECPSTLTCAWVPAAHAENDPGPFDYGNYAFARRPHDLAINQIVIHETEGSLAASLANFQDQTSYVSVQYTIDTDGKVYQSVRLQDIAYQAGNFYVNMHSVGIEHVGYSEQNGITAAQYQSSAILAKWLAQKFHFPLNRATVVGHGNVPSLSDSGMAGMHWDPGPYWDWQRYMKLLGAPVVATAGKNSSVITIRPNYASNLQALQDCSVLPCVDVEALPTNFLALHTAPSESAPLLSDPYIHPDGSPGTTAQNDWGDQAPYGLSFRVIERQQGWVGIWFEGQKAWLKDDGGNTVATTAFTVTPKSNKSVQLYGGPLPEPSAPEWSQLPSGPVFQLTQVALSKYNILPGQFYVTTGVAIDDYAEGCAAVDCTYEGDGVVVHGKDVYLRVNFSARPTYVKLADVNVYLGGLRITGARLESALRKDQFELAR